MEDSNYGGTYPSWIVGPQTTTTKNKKKNKEEEEKKKKKKKKQYYNLDWTDTVLQACGRFATPLLRNITI